MEKCRECDTEANLMCITKHRGFQSVALYPWNLQAVYYEYRQKYGDLDEPTLHKLLYDSSLLDLLLLHTVTENRQNGIL